MTQDSQPAGAQSCGLKTPNTDRNLFEFPLDGLDFLGKGSMHYQ
jgi:hypothetical protein